MTTTPTTADQLGGTAAESALSYAHGPTDGPLRDEDNPAFSRRVRVLFHDPEERSDALAWLDRALQEAGP